MPDADAATPARKRMRVFRFDEATDHLDMEMVGLDAEVLAGFEQLKDAGLQDAQRTRVLFSEPGGEGLSVVHAWFKSGFIVPRHSHSADCCYYVLSGAVELGGAVLGKGDGVFVPAEMAYTFKAGASGVEMLEFRNATHFNIHYKGNDAAHWRRIADSAAANRDAWKTQTMPHSRNVTAE